MNCNNINVIRIKDGPHKGEKYETAADWLDVPIRDKGWETMAWSRYKVVDGNGYYVKDVK